MAQPHRGNIKETLRAYTDTVPTGSHVWSYLKDNLIFSPALITTMHLDSQPQYSLIPKEGSQSRESFWKVSLDTEHRLAEKARITYEAIDEGYKKLEGSFMVADCHMIQDIRSLRTTSTGFTMRS